MERSSNSIHWSTFWAFSINLFLWVLTCAAIFSSPGFAALSDHQDLVKVEPIDTKNKYPAGGSYPLIIKLNIAKSWYIHGTESSSGLIPTTLQLYSKEPGIKISRILFPTPVQKKFPYVTEPVSLFSGTVQIKAIIQIHRDVLPGEYNLSGTLTFQACSDYSCVPPDTLSFNIPIEVVKQGEDINPVTGKYLHVVEKGPAVQDMGGTGLLLSLSGIFLAGLALNLTPCIYPLLPITVSYFGGTGFKGIRIVHAILYITGISITNSLLGLIASMSGGMLGSVLQNPVALIAVSSVLFILALSFFGLWELRLPHGITRLALKNFGGYFGSFFMGLTLGIIAAPCIGPFILGLMTYVGQKGSPFLGFIYFFTLSLGIGFPLMILALFSGGIKRLPVSGEWMVWVRRFFGWILLGMGAYVIRPLVPQGYGEAALFSTLLAGAGLDLGWFSTRERNSKKFSAAKKVVGTLLMGSAVGCWFMFTSTGNSIQWQPYSEEALKNAMIANRPVILDFSAEWCLPCKELEIKVFRDPDVVRLSRRFVMLRMDLTTRHPRQEEIMKKYGVHGVPTVIFINRKGREISALRVESYVDREEFLKRMREAVVGST